MKETKEKNIAFKLLIISLLIFLCFIFLHSFFIFVLFFSFLLCLIECFTKIFKKDEEKHKKTANIIIASLCVLMCVSMSPLLLKHDYKNSEYVVHAGGSLENKRYLNCVESVEYFVENGCNLIELDFMFTKDNEIICTHFFENYEGYSIKNRPTLQQALNTKILNKYSTLSFDKLIEILKENPTVKIIFDTKENDDKNMILKMLEISDSKNFNLKSRMIIQVFSYENYKEMNELNFDEYWFTNYKVMYSPTVIKNYFSQYDNITTIVLYEFYWKNYPFVDEILNKKIAIHFIYGLNDDFSINFLKNRGIDYIYIDFLP